MYVHAQVHTHLNKHKQKIKYTILEINNDTHYLHTNVKITSNSLYTRHSWTSVYEGIPTRGWSSFDVARENVLVSTTNKNISRAESVYFILALLFHRVTHLLWKKLRMVTIHYYMKLITSLFILFIVVVIYNHLKMFYLIFLRFARIFYFLEGLNSVGWLWPSFITRLLPILYLKSWIEIFLKLTTFIFYYFNFSFYFPYTSYSHS